MIQTEIWTEPNEKCETRYLSQRLAKDVFTDVKSYIGKTFTEIESLYLDVELEPKDAIFPEGRVCVFVVPGRSEGYIVNICALKNDETYKQVISLKVWDMNEAHSLVKFLYEGFYGENGRGFF